MLWAFLLLAGQVATAQVSFGSDKLFLVTKYICHVAGGQVWVTTGTQDAYSEILGSTAPVSRQVCGKSYFDTRSCINVSLYNFKVACRDGVATAPQLFMALFGKDKSTRDFGFALTASDQLSYFDPVHDFSGSSGRTVLLPLGYAPLHTKPIETVTRRLTWDDRRQRLSLPRNLSEDQERRIRSLFVVRSGYVEPFLELKISRAVSIAEE